MIAAHDSPLAALTFNASATKLASASERVRNTFEVSDPTWHLIEIELLKKWKWAIFLPAEIPSVSRNLVAASSLATVLVQWAGLATYWSGRKTRGQRKCWTLSSPGGKRKHWQGNRFRHQSPFWWANARLFSPVLPRFLLLSISIAFSINLVLLLLHGKDSILTLFVQPRIATGTLFPFPVEQKPDVLSLCHK